MKNRLSLVLALILSTSSLTAAEENQEVYLHSIWVVESDDYTISDQEGVISSVLSEEGRKRLEVDFIGKVVSEELVQQVAREILRDYRARNQLLVSLQFPEADLTAGILIVRADCPRVGCVSVEGEEWFSEGYYKDRLRLNQDQTLDEEKLLNNIAFLNSNPFHHVEAVVSPGLQAGSTDVEFLVKDRFPVRFWVGSDSTGVEFTDQARLFGGLTIGNMWFRGDLLSYQYTTAPNPHRFQSHTLNSLTYLPWKHEIHIYGGYSVIHPDITNFTSEGKSAQASFRYEIPVRPIYTSLKQQVAFGFDYKNLNSDLLFVGEATDQTVTIQNNNLTQLCVSYEARQDFVFKAEIFYSPFKWLHDQTDTTYGLLRPGANVIYGYGRGSIGYNYITPRNWTLSFLARGQGASGALLPSEQFSLGGYDTVRGYEERVFLADNAICGNIELRAPWFSLARRKNDRVVMLAFADAGWGNNYDVFDPEEGNQYLTSIGLGTRYDIGTYLNFRADYGFLLHKVVGDDHFGRFHLGGVISY